MKKAILKRLEDNGLAEVDNPKEEVPKLEVSQIVTETQKDIKVSEPVVQGSIVTPRHEAPKPLKAE